MIIVWRWRACPLFVRMVLPTHMMPIPQQAQLMRKDSNASSSSYQSVPSSDSSASSYCHVLTPTSGALDEAGEGEGWNEFLKLGIDPTTTQSTISEHCKATSKKRRSSLRSKFRLFFPKEQNSSEASLHNSRGYGSKSEPVTPSVEKSDLYKLNGQPMTKEYYIPSSKESSKKLVKFDISNINPERELSSSFKIQTRVPRPSLVKKVCLFDDSNADSLLRRLRPVAPYCVALDPKIISH